VTPDVQRQLYLVLLLASCARNTPGESIVRKEHITQTATLKVGTSMIVEAPSPSAEFKVVFEDDGETGYFYGLDPSRGAEPVVDALHIYNVTTVTDRPALVLQVAWSASGQQAALLINSRPHAVFDFSSKRGYCRTGFPPPNASWTSHSHDWDDAALNAFR
jgi:hypothetical protein